ncbi:hypothetical protein B0H19DRAFT_1116052 [Mycena capillaripes]|nr:hypothetical protein B0H19DRAFT_1116052 [Mycena capillaripes]
MSMPSSPCSSSLASDIRALTTALAQISSRTSPTSTKSVFEHHENGHGPGPNKCYDHIATLLTRDGMDDAQADICLAGATMHGQFALFAVHQSPPSSPESTAASSPLCIAIKPAPGAGLPSAPSKFRSTKIRFESLHQPQPPLSTGKMLEAVLKTGLNAVDLNQHVSDVKQILWGFLGYDLPEDDGEERQTKCLIFFLQRSIEKLTQRFHDPRVFFSTECTPWWRMLTQWDPDPEDFPMREFNVKYHVAVIFNALAPGLITYYLPTVLDCDTAIKCVIALAVLLDVIDGKLLACKQPSRLNEDWERLNTTLRMLYSLIYDTEIIRHIFFNSSLSAHLLALSRFAQCGEIVSDDDKRDGPFLFRQLQKIVAWQRAVLVLASTKVVRAAVPIHFNLISIPPPSVESTPIMNLVNEIYSSRRLRTLIRRHLAERGIFSDDSKAISSHYNASLLGLLMAADYCEYSDIFAKDVATDPGKIREIKDGILQVITTGKKCCYACEKLASLLLKDSAPSFDAVVCPWTPPLGITPEVLSLLRDDLMDQFKHHLEGVVLLDAFTSPEYMEEHDFDQPYRNHRWI